MNKNTFIAIAMDVFFEEKREKRNYLLGAFSMSICII